MRSKPLIRRAAFAAALASLGCRRPSAAAPAPASIAAEEDYCWWHVMSSPLPVDTVAARFANAFTNVGLRDARWERRADTAWATASLTALPAQGGAVRYASRMVGFRKGDSTHFRTYVTIQPPLVGWQLADTADGAATRRRIAACGAIARAAAVNASASRDATGEETFTVWSKTP